MLSKISGLFGLSLLLFSSCSKAQKVTKNNKGNLQKSTVDIGVFPETEPNQKQFVIQLPARANEGNYRVQIVAGKTVPVDKCNKHFMTGTFSQKLIEGFGYDYFEVKSTGDVGSTMMACNDNSRVMQFVSVVNDAVLPYNSAMPVVVYAPEGFEVKYRVWTAGQPVPVQANQTKTPSKPRLIRDCPEKKITDKMPTIGKPKANRSYYIYKGKRAEIADFDSVWLRKNCDVSEETVY